MVSIVDSTIVSIENIDGAQSTFDSIVSAITIFFKEPWLGQVEAGMSQNSGSSSSQHHNWSRTGLLFNVTTEIQKGLDHKAAILGAPGPRMPKLMSDVETKLQLQFHLDWNHLESLSAKFCTTV